MHGLIRETMRNFPYDEASQISLMPFHFTHFLNTFGRSWLFYNSEDLLILSINSNDFAFKIFAERFVKFQ
jgi:hypothetical protein